MFEGAPDFPTKDRWWGDRRASPGDLYTAPDRDPLLHEVGEELPAAHMTSLAPAAGNGPGEPINPKAGSGTTNTSAAPLPDRRHRVADRNRAAMISPAGHHHDEAGVGHATVAGIPAAIFDNNGNEIEEGGGTRPDPPSPAMARTLSRNRALHQRLLGPVRQGDSTVGDAARRDEDGYFWIVGRIDDVINVSGHRLSTMEIESAGFLTRMSPRRR